MRFLLTHFILLLSCQLVIAQAVFTITYKYVDTALPAQQQLKTNFNTRRQAQQYIAEMPGLLLAKGFLAASIDSVKMDSTMATVWLYTDKKYNWGSITIQPDLQPFIKNIFDKSLKKETDIAHFYTTNWQQNLLDHFANIGYPFARVGIDSVKPISDSLYGKLIFEKGPLYKIDSIHLNGKLKLKPNFIYPYLHLKKNMIYNQQLLNHINQRLNELVFAQQAQPWELSMLGSGSTVNLYLQPKKSNIINVLLGLLPASSVTPNEKLMVTGDVNILLRNAFYLGESIGINWQQIQYKSPRLNLFFQQPYIAGTQIGADVSFELFKKDSQFVNIKLKIGIPYEFSTAHSASVFFQQQSTNVAYVDTQLVKNTLRLPAIADVSSNGMGVTLQWNSTDYKQNPRRGCELFISGLAGIKKIKKNNAITGLANNQQTNFSFGSLYDTVKLKSYQAKIMANGAGYIPCGKLTVLKLALNAAYYQSQNYFRNELFQIGGYKLLRGFDEESIYAKNYIVGTAEYRFLTGKNGYFFGFSDAGMATYKDQQLQYTHTYIGAGLGLAFETKNTLVNLSWAAGKRNDLPLNLRQSKIHLGFINYF